MEKVEKFWQWFQDHNEQLIALGDLADKEREELLKALQYQLTKYCNGLTYEMGDPTADGRSLTFTAEGDTDLFRYVVELVDAAPDLDWWQFVAFKQPLGTDLKVRFDKMLFETKKMYFQQLECEEEPEMLGLRIAVEDGQREDERACGAAAQRVHPRDRETQDEGCADCREHGGDSERGGRSGCCKQGFEHLGHFLSMPRAHGRCGAGYGRTRGLGARRHASAHVRERARRSRWRRNGPMRCRTSRRTS